MKKMTKLFVSAFIALAVFVSASAVTLDTAESNKTTLAEVDSGLLNLFDGNIINGSADGEGKYTTATVTFGEGVEEWTVDVGNTGATVEEFDGFIKITAAGYAGEVTVTAKAGDLTDTEVITIVGRDAGKWLPGVDLVSGTKAGWTFDFSDDVNNVVGYCANGSYYSNAVVAAASGTSHYVVRNYPDLGDRPVEVSAYVGGYGTGYGMQIEGVNLESTFAPGTGKHSYKLVGGAADRQLIFSFVAYWGAYSLDNISAVPYYKVTYYGLDGSEVSSEYILPEDGKLIPELSKVEGATGFALSADGDAVSEVILTNKDVELYAVKKTSATFVAGNESKEVDLEEGSFTLPSAESLGLTATNFRAWTDGTSFFEEGEVVEDAMSLEGKTFTAVCFEAKLFDINKGDLVFFFDYESGSWNKPTYLNKAYTSGIGTTLQQIDNTWMKVVDGHLEVHGSVGQYQVFGYSVDYNAKTSGATATTTIDLANHTSYAGLAVNGLFFNKGADFAWNNGYMYGGFLNTSAENDTWYSKTFYMTDEERTGFTGNVVQLTNYNGLNSSVLYVDNWAFYVYPEKTFVLLDAQGSDTFTRIDATEENYTMPAHGDAIAWTNGKDTFVVGESYRVADLQHKTLYPVYLDTEKYKAPEMMNITEIRGTDSNNGIRFKAVIMPSVKENLDEIGFITTREVLLPMDESVYNYDALTFNHKDANDNRLYAYAVSYDADGEIDVINSNGEDGSIVYSAVLTGIPLDFKNEKMVVRAYAKFEMNGKSFTVYGNTACDSLYSTAYRIKEANGDAYNVNKTYIDTIVG